MIMMIHAHSLSIISYQILSPIIQSNHYFLITMTQFKDPLRKSVRFYMNYYKARIALAPAVIFY